jgi:lipopolysaccharide/colanic/teichoic acid biosynthesis glycosyltransferase
MTSSQLAVDGSYMPATDAEVSKWNSSFGKRLLDIIGSSAVLALASPLMLLVAGAVKAGSAGPVLFRQQRVAKGGAEFEMLKFRTMYHRPPDRSPGITRKGDSRVTPVGKLLRKWKIDELPQLINVLRGQMSLIGPRPDLPEFYSTLTPARRQILRLKPGMTGWATLHFRDEESVLAAVPPEGMLNFYLSDLLPRKVDLDLSYARAATLKGDLGILLQTFVAILPTGAKPSRGDR